MRFLFLFLGLTLLQACERSEKVIRVSPTSDSLPETTSQEPRRIKIQHILIAFEGSLDGKSIERSKEDAEKLANELLEELKLAPEKFEKLLIAHSDDQIPGIYRIANVGEDPQEEEFPRSVFVSGFTELSFKLAPAEIQLLPYDKERSPYGYHLIRRIE